jgi:hypothetical protein
MATRVPIVVRTIVLFEEASLADEIWTFRNAITELVQVSGPIPRMFLYFQMTGGLASYNLSVQLRSFESKYVLGTSGSVRVSFPRNRTVVLEQVFRFESIRFPRSDVYEFQLIANHTDVAGGVYRLNVQVEGSEP